MWVYVCVLCILYMPIIIIKNPCLLKLVYSLWYDRLVMSLWWSKTGYIWHCFGHFKVAKYGFGKLSLCGVHYYVSKFVWTLLYNIWVMWLYGDLKLALFKIVLATLKPENMVFGNLNGFGKLSLRGVNSCVSKFAWRLLCYIRVMWLYDDLKLTIFKMLWSP